MIRIQCRCRFDITITSVTGYFKPEKLPFLDATGREIINQQQWIESRNQHRNWETITQILSLRTQVFETTSPKKNGNWWIFEFSVDSASVYSDSASSDLNILKSDANNVPMLICDNNDVRVEMTITHGKNANLIFALLA